jgi:hypothetical protein
VHSDFIYHMLTSFSFDPSLGGHSEENQRAAYLYGTYVGQAFQLIDDALDFEGTRYHLWIITAEQERAYVTE